MRLLPLLVLVLLCPTALLGQSTDSLGSLQPLSPLIGTWDCQGIAHDLSGGPSRSYTSRIEVAPTLSRRWLAFAVQVTLNGAPSPVSEGLDYWGLDPTTGHWQELFLDSSGGAGQGALLEVGPTRFRYRGEGSGAPTEHYYEVVFELRASAYLAIRYHASADEMTWRLRTEDSCRRLPG